jgi:hypothetical protein
VSVDRGHHLDRAAGDRAVSHRREPTPEPSVAAAEAGAPAFATNRSTGAVLDALRRASGADAEGRGDGGGPGPLWRAADLPVQGSGPLDPGIASAISAERGGGAPLEDGVRADMEAHLGADLSGVRVHTDGRADELSRSVQAEAFTTGSDIFFKTGGYDPASSTGRGLLGHELTHVVQQSTGLRGPNARGGAAGGADRVSHPDDPHEREAAEVGRIIATGPRAPSPAAPAESAEP